MEKFCSYPLLRNKEKIQISFQEIAIALSISERTAKRYIKKDLESGFITKESTQYQCRKYKTLLSGRNIYTLTEKGQDHINSSKRRGLTPQSLIKKNSSKEEFAKGKPAGSFSQFKREKEKILGKYKVSYLVSRAPHWWFRDLAILEKTLKLLNYKKKKGYRVKNEERWISSVFRDRGRGYRHKVAKKTALVLANNRKESWKVLGKASDRVLSDFDRLRELKKRGLKTPFIEMEKLLRKGFSHLASCTEVLLKLLKYQTIQNLNGFLNWLVSLKEPFEVFQKGFNDVKEVIEWARSIFTEEAKQCVFERRGEFERWKQKKEHLDPKKVFVRFRIFKEDEKSFISLLYQEGSLWKEDLLNVTDPLFKQGVLQGLGRGIT